MDAPLIKIENLKKYFPVRTDNILGEKKYVKAVDGVNLDVFPGEIVGLVGESGCGKTTLVNVLLRLDIPTNGNICFDGIDITNKKTKDLRSIRKNMQIVFQDPFWSLNPRMLIREVIGEPLNVHSNLSAIDRNKRVEKLLDMVGLAKDSLHKYPHEFSGGQRQRIAIARAIALEPKLIILDEPTSSIDILSQAQILDLLLQLKKELGLTYIIISHDLSVVYYMSDRIVVMYLGKVVEIGPSTEIFNNPMHPYTQALLRAIPNIQMHNLDDLFILEGNVPSAINLPSGCRFHQRCPKSMEICKQIEPTMIQINGKHSGACHLLSEANITIS